MRTIEIKRILYEILRTEFTTVKNTKRVQFFVEHGKHTIAQCAGITVVYELLDCHGSFWTHIDSMQGKFYDRLYSSDKDWKDFDRLSIWIGKKIYETDDHYLKTELIRLLMEKQDASLF